MTGNFYGRVKHYLLLGRLFGITVFAWEDGPVWKSALLHVPFYLVYTVGNVQAYRIIVDADFGVYTKMGYISLFLENVLFMASRFPYYTLRACYFRKTLHKINSMSGLRQRGSNPHVLILTVGFLFTTAYILIEFVGEGVGVATIFYFNGTMVELYDELIAFLILRELHSQYKHINDELNEDVHFLGIEKVRPVDGKLKNANISVIKSNEKNAYLNRIFHLCGEHLRISKICKRVNCIIGLPALGFFGVAFTVITLDTHYITTQIKNIAKGEEYNPVMLYAKIAQITVLLCRLVIYINGMSRVAAEAKATVCYLHKLWNTLASHGEVDLKAKHLKLLVVQLYNARPAFSTNGLYEIDWPVILMIVGATATYVVILIQFEIAIGAF